MPFVSIVTPCYNEQDNIYDLYKQVKAKIESLSNYTYEHLFIDNASKDHTASRLIKLAEDDKNVKVILNTRNFGHIRSPFYALLQASGEAVILMAADLQEPPHLIEDFLKKWEQGYKVVLGVKSESEESIVMFTIRKLYYSFISKIADIELTKNNTGFGLYDKKIIEILKKIEDPYPYFRGLISELGFESFKINYKQHLRKRGVSSNNFYRLYDIAMLGITSHSKVPLRIATMSGFFMAVASFITGCGYLAAKLVLWPKFPIGIAPLILGVFFFSSIQLFFIGIIGEYVGFIYTQALKRPLVVEKARFNF